MGSHVSEHELTCVYGEGPHPKNKPLLSLLQIPVPVLLGFDALRQTDPLVW